MNHEDIRFLSQLVKSLDDAGKNLEKSYDKKDYDGFNKSRKIILSIQEEISGMLK